MEEMLLALHFSLPEELSISLPLLDSSKAQIWTEFCVQVWFLLQTD